MLWQCALHEIHEQCGHVCVIGHMHGSDVLDLRLLKEKTKFSVPFQGDYADDSDSCDGAIDDVLLSPATCRWRKIASDMSTDA